MNDVQREIKLRRLTDWIGTSPAPVKVMGKVRALPWTLEKNDHYFYTVIETIPSTPSHLIISSTIEADEKQYTCGTPRLLESFGWILPRFENITSINILDGNAKSLICEMAWKVNVTKFYNRMSRKKQLPSSAGVTNGVWRIFKNKMPERILMNCKENKAIYKRLCNREYESFGRDAKQYRKEHKSGPVVSPSKVFRKGSDR